MTEYNIDPSKTSKIVIHPIDIFEQDYPELGTEFKRIQAEQYDLFARKMNGYGLGNISVGTNLDTEEEKKLSLTGIWFRSNDKINRLKQLVLLGKDNSLADESVVDTWKDLSVYGIIAQIVTNNKWKK
jgi:hypothetical protein